MSKTNNDISNNNGVNDGANNNEINNSGIVFDWKGTLNQLNYVRLVELNDNADTHYLLAEQIENKDESILHVVFTALDIKSVRLDSVDKNGRNIFHACALFNFFNLVKCIEELMPEDNYCTREEYEDYKKGNDPSYSDKKIEDKENDYQGYVAEFQCWRGRILGLDPLAHYAMDSEEKVPLELVIETFEVGDLIQGTVIALADLYESRNSPLKEGEEKTVLEYLREIHNEAGNHDFGNILPEIEDDDEEDEDEEDEDEEDEEDNEDALNSPPNPSSPNSVGNNPNSLIGHRRPREEGENQDDEVLKYLKF